MLPKLSRRRALLLAILITLIGAARIVATYGIFSHTIDEPDHLAAGMQWLDAGKYTYEDQHPPLARVFGAIGPYLAGERWRKQSDAYGEGFRILGFDSHYERVLNLGRAGMLPFFFLASAVVFLWGERVGGLWAACAATFLFTTLPPVLGHAGLITNDMAAAAFTGAAALASLYWVDFPTKKRAILLGLTIGFAALAKFSCLLFLPAAWLAMFAVHRRPIRWRTFPLIAAIAFLTIWAGYRFSFAGVDYLHMRLPAARFFLGLNALWNHNKEGHLSYLLGKTSNTGFWYYFPTVLAVKTPLSLLILTGWSAFAARRRAIALPLAFSGAILIAASFSRINIGVRHVLPVYIGMCVAAGAFAVHTRFRAVAALLITWQFASGIAHHPNYLAYTNEAILRPEQWVVDSDLDWGQDMNRLNKRLQEAGVRQLTFTPFNRTYSTLAGHRLPTIVPLNLDKPLPGWNAISLTMWKLYGIPHWADHPPKSPGTHRRFNSSMEFSRGNWRRGGDSNPR